MSDSVNYQRAYQRERLARIEAERLLAEKTRDLYDNVIVLEKTLKELKISQHQLVQSVKMAAIGQFAAGVAHEINNPIGFSISNLQTLGEYVEQLFKLDQWMMEQVPLTDDVKKSYQQQKQALLVEEIKSDSQLLIEETLVGLERVRYIVASLRAVTDSGGESRQRCDVNACVDAALKNAQKHLEATMSVVKHLTSPLPLVCADITNIQQVLVNLFINAAHACGEKGTLTITTQPHSHQGAVGVLIQVQDNGVGMTEAVKERIFDPFYTTKKVGEGAGLGLSVTRNLVEKHGGHISVQSEVGWGSCFEVFLPLNFE